MNSQHMQIGEVARRTELSLRTIRHYEESGLVVPSARSRGGFRLYTEGDVARLMVIRRMKPLGFTLDEMRDLLDAVDRLDAAEALDAGDAHDAGEALDPGEAHDAGEALDPGEAHDAGEAHGAGEPLAAGEREALLERVRAYERSAAEQVTKLRTQLARAEEFALTLRTRLERSGPPAPDGDALPDLERTGPPEA
ncbi:MerR family transcriptional regulator [Streptomyces sp. NPDC047737]|uniref:MerR family transcriptional regulator n=1 Tax=Streptomyces sp. NPDC047737 TaxID=3155740 RepID=UPI0033FE1A36